MQREPAGDLELNHKKRARRRLVGAIALVLLMIFVLPLVLKDRSASSTEEAITITLPEDRVATNEPSDFDSSIVPTTPTAPAESPEIPPTEAIPQDTEAAPVETPVAAEKKESNESKPEQKAEVKPIPPAASSKFHVQIGVFSDEANVKKMQVKLTDLGYKSSTEKVDTAKGTKIRLKTQAFADRNEAAIALQNIKDAGLTGMVVSQ